MSRIHISRDRQTLGQFGPDEVAVGLKSGRFLPTDLAWREGMESWQPLSTFTDLPEVSAPAVEPTPQFAPGTEILEPVGATPPSPPWEEDKPWFSRLIETVKAVLLAPQEAFSNVPTDSNILRSIWFMTIIGWPAMVVSLGYQLAFELVGPATQENMEELGPVFTVVIYGVCALFMPVFLVVGSFISSAIFHGMLMMLGAAGRSYWATFRLVTYVNGATMVLLFVPLCGGFAQSIWAICALTVGLKTVHQTTWVNAIVTLLLPSVICCGIIVGAISLGVSQFIQ